MTQKFGNSSRPSKLDFCDLDAPLIGAFLDHLEAERHNSARTRNARLAAIHSMFRIPRPSCTLSTPDQSNTCSPSPRSASSGRSSRSSHERRPSRCSRAPDRATWIASTTHTLTLAIQTGLWVGELVGCSARMWSSRTGRMSAVTAKAAENRHAAHGSWRRDTPRLAL